MASSASHPTNGNNNGHVKRKKDGDVIESPPFISSTTWQGSKSGYYFGTGDHGTGYYLDAKDSHNLPSSTTKTSSSRLHKRTRFDESANETAIIINTTSSTTKQSSSSSLLEQAETRAAGTSRVVALTPTGVQMATQNLQKTMEHNALQRAHAQEQHNNNNNPTIYMESEIALYEAIVSLKAFAAAPEALYPIMVRQTDIMELLVQLLMHENVDIAVAVTSVLLEWLDPELFVADQETTATTIELVASFCESGAAEMLVDNLARMMNQEENVETTDDDDEVGRGIQDILSIFENVMEIETNATRPILKQQSSSSSSSSTTLTSVARFLAGQTKLISWLLENISDGGSSIWKPRCLELLAYMALREEVHATLPNWKRIPCYSSTFQSETNKNSRNEDSSSQNKTMDGMEILLQCVATFRKRQPSDETEVEILENACIFMTAALTYNPKAVEDFREAQGIELVLRCLKERVYAGALTLPWLDFAGHDPIHRKACEHMVCRGALKYLFPIFLGRNLPKYHDQEARREKQKKAKKEFRNKIETTVIRILYALVRQLRDDSPEDAKQRVLAKFADPDGNEKVARLVDLLIAYDQKTRLAEYKFYRSDAEEALSEAGTENREQMLQLAALDAKLAGGGDILHRLAAIAAFCCVGSRRCHEQIMSLLQEKELGMGLIREALEEFVSVLGDAEQKEQLERYLDQI